MLNHISIQGRLTRDPELRRTGSGTAVASFAIACDRDYVPEGQQRETDFVDIIAWKSLGEFAAKWFRKGNLCVVDGRLQIREWTDKDGNKRRTAEVNADHIYFCEKKEQSTGGYEPITTPDGNLPF